MCYCFFFFLIFVECDNGQGEKKKWYKVIDYVYVKKSGMQIVRVEGERKARSDSVYGIWTVIDIVNFLIYSVKRASSGLSTLTSHQQ